MSEIDPRYERQMLVPELGEDGQRRLLDSKVAVLGCGALGSNQSTLLVRAGVGHVRIADRDRLEPNNLHRQVLFDEDDFRAHRSKAQAAAAKLRRINSGVVVEDHFVEVDASNIEALVDGMDVVLDGADNFELRYLLNDACIAAGIPWIYGGVIGTVGMTLPILPGRGPCLRCLFPDPPPPGALPTTSTHGVLNTIPTFIAALQVTGAYQVLLDPDLEPTPLLHVDLWTRSFRHLEVKRDPDCPACGQGKLEFLRG